MDLAFICHFHDCGNNKAIKKRLNNEMYMDQYERIRARSLAALLTLADNLDGTYSRTVPNYLLGDDEVSLVNKFRKKIANVSPQCSQTIKSVLKYGEH